MKIEPRVVVATILLVVIVGASIYFPEKPIKIEEEGVTYAKVPTAFGCVETIVSQEDFAKQQWFTDRVLGGHFLTCDG